MIRLLFIGMFILSGNTLFADSGSLLQNKDAPLVKGGSIIKKEQEPAKTDNSFRVKNQELVGGHRDSTSKSQGNTQETARSSDLKILQENSTRKENKIVSIGLIVDTLNPDHYVSIVNKMIKLATEYDLIVSDLYLYGFNFEFYRKVDLSKLIPRMANFNNVFEIPEKFQEYEIKSSPVWILGTSEGRYVIEGESNIEKYMPKGYFSTPTVSN